MCRTLDEGKETMMRWVWGLLLLGALLPCSGCGQSEAQLRNDLKQVGLAYHNYHDTHKKGPPNWEEFLAFAESANEPVDSLRRVRDAGYQVQWEVDFSRVAEGLANGVMARPSGPGPTLMMDGSVSDL
jgi:hypothetical protein